MNSPFKIMTQRHELVFNFRVNDPFWQTCDVESLLRDMNLVFAKGWQVDHCRRFKTEHEIEAIEVTVFRNVSAWRAFMEPYPVIR